MPPLGHRAHLRTAASTYVVRLAPALVVVAFALALAHPALGHAEDSLPAPTVGDILGWSFDLTVQVPLLLVAALYLWAVRHVDRAHPANPVPVARTLAFMAGLVTIEIALQSVIGAYDDTLFSDHMVQHVLLTMVAAPLLVLGAPITLLLRVARPEHRRRWILPVLHSRIVRALSHPVVAWILFAAAMWGTHFSPMFELSLENSLIHDLEHTIYLATAILFWWPAMGVDPSPWRMPHPLRLLYVFLQMPQNTFLGLAIFSASTPLYPHYASLVLPWAPSALADQQIAGGLMWVSGDLLFLVEILFIVVGWMREEEKRTAREDARADADLVAVRARSGAGMAERRASPREEGPDLEIAGDVEAVGE